MRITTESQPSPKAPGLIKRNSGRIALLAGLGVGMAGGGWALVEQSNKELRPTTFASVGDAWATLKANAEQYGSGTLLTPGQGKQFDRDVRGAMPLVVGDIAQKTVAATAVHEGSFTLPDGRKVTVHAGNVAGGSAASIESELVASNGTKKQARVDVMRDKQGGLEKVELTEDIDHATGMGGGAGFTYDPRANKITVINSTHMLDGSDTSGVIREATIIDDGPASVYQDPALATNEIVDVLSDAYAVMADAEVLPHK